MSKTKPTGKTEKLTAKQVAQLALYRARWLGYGLSTAQAEREKAVRHIGAAYRAAGLEPPPIVVWLASPMAGAIGAELLTRAPGALRVRAQVGDQVGDQVWDQVGAQVGDQVSRAGYGQHDANWLGFYEYFAEVCGLQDKVKKLEGLIGIGKTCGWWWPFRGAVILTERPCFMQRDETGRLHSEHRAAIEYPDGWGVYAWHGTRVPKEWILAKDALKAADVLGHQNVEQRRAGCEILGWKRILEELKPIVVNEDVEPEIGTLLRADLPGAPGSQFLKVRCGTGRDFVLPVPPNMKTALEANAWTYGLEAKELQLEART